jgi:hypothetical protein
MYGFYVGAQSFQKIFTPPPYPAAKMKLYFPPIRFSIADKYMEIMRINKDGKKSGTLFSCTPIAHNPRKRKVTPSVSIKPPRKS